MFKREAFHILACVLLGDHESANYTARRYFRVYFCSYSLPREKNVKCMCETKI